MNIWQTIFFQPLFNILVGIYNLVGDMGLAIIVLTILFKLILYPLSLKSLKSQRALQALQPKVDKLRQEFKDNKERLAKELMALYQTEKVSPTSSCLPLIVQLPFLIALYQVFQKFLDSSSFNLLYPFISQPGQLSDGFLGIINLGQVNYPLAVVAGLAQYWQTKMLATKQPPLQVPGSKDESLAAAMNKQMLYVMPVLTAIFGFSLPSGLVLYWLINILFTIAQQYVVFPHQKHNITAVS